MTIIFGTNQLLISLYAGSNDQRFCVGRTPTRSSVQITADAAQRLGGGLVFFVLGQSFTVFVFRAQPVALRFVALAEIHVRIAVAFIARRVKSSVEPWNGFIDLALHHQV